MSKNTGQSYELLTQDVYQQLLNYKGGEYLKIDVQHDVKIIGKTGVEHQIDVYWEFNLAGVHYKTILEVKDWNSKVKKEQIMSFKAKIDDIPGTPTGIFVSKSGFQSGALEYARVHGIKLATIDETHTMNHIAMTYHFRFPHVEHLSIILDKQWLTAAKEANGISDEIKISYRVAESLLCDEEGSEKAFVEFIREAQKPYCDNAGTETTHITHIFEKPWYLLTEDNRLPKVMLHGFEFDFYITESEEVREFHPDWVADYILRDLTDGTQTGFNSVHGVIDLKEQVFL